MSLRRIDLNLLTVFDAVFTEGNLTRAAEHIGMSQPAMSNALSRLRSAIKDDLFVREGRGIRPTPRAIELAPEVRKALHTIEHALEVPGSFNPRDRHRFSIAGFDYFEIVLLPRILKELTKRSPNLELRSATGTSATLGTALRYGEIDLIIDYVPITSSEYCFDVLYSDPLVILTRKDHPHIQGEITLEDFRRHRFAVRESRPDEPIGEIDQLLGASGHKRNVAVSVNNWLALPPLVADSDLICTCGRRFAEVFAKRFPLKIYPVPFDIRPIPVYLIWHESQEGSRAHRWLRAQIKRICRRI